MGVGVQRFSEVSVLSTIGGKLRWAPGAIVPGVPLILVYPCGAAKNVHEFHSPSRYRLISLSSYEYCRKEQYFFLSTFKRIAHIYYGLCHSLLCTQHCTYCTRI